jgi:hypothetical protein
MGRLPTIAMMTTIMRMNISICLQLLFARRSKFSGVSAPNAGHAEGYAGRFI